MPRELLFSVTKRDLEIETFTVSGAGGQGRDHVNTGVRVRHKASGAVGEARDSRHQSENKKNAFIRMAKSKKFEAWRKLETARRSGELQRIEETVDRLLHPRHIKTEVKVNGRWTEVQNIELRVDSPL